MIGSITHSAWRVLGKRRIYFGHQSVGQNLVDAMQALAADVPWAEGNDPSLFARPVFAHSRIGVNRDPQSKIGAFATTLRNGVGDRADIALFKFCYIDVVATTDVAGLFQHYAQTVASLQTQFPQTAIVHITTPLTAVPPRWHRWLGAKSAWSKAIADNQTRARFNETMRRRYIGREPLFDLARCEAGVNGRATSAEEYGLYQTLDRRLTSDGGHLNRLGAELIGTALLDLLSSLPAPVEHGLLDTRRRASGS